MWIGLKKTLSTGNFVLGLAVGAKAEDTQAMMRRMKMILSGDFVLFSLDDLTVKLDQETALGADKMVVMLVIEIVLVTFTAVAEALLTSQPAFVQELERTIDGGEPDAGILSFDPIVEVFRAQMPFGLEKNFENQLTLGSLLKPCPAQVIKEDLFLLRHFAHI